MHRAHVGKLAGFLSGVPEVGNHDSVLGLVDVVDQLVVFVYHQERYS